MVLGAFSTSGTVAGLFALSSLAVHRPVRPALLVAALAHPASRLGPILGSQPLRWIGERSYGIYLWHIPVLFFFLAAMDGVYGPQRLVLGLIGSAFAWVYAAAAPLALEPASADFSLASFSKATAAIFAQKKASMA